MSLVSLQELAGFVPDGARLALSMDDAGVSMAATVALIARGVRNLALLSDAGARQAEKARIDDMKARNAKLLANLAETLRSDEGRRLLGELQAAGRPYDAAMDKAVQLAMANDSAAAIAFLLGEVRTTQNGMFKATDALIDFQQKLMREAEAAARDLEDRVSAPLSPEERTTLMRLLRKIYKPEPSAPALKAEK